MLGEPVLPRVQNCPLVHTTGGGSASATGLTLPESPLVPSVGPPAPPSGGVDEQAAGDPAAIQSASTPISAGVAGDAGAGGMGLAGSCMRARASRATEVA